MRKPSVPSDEAERLAELRELDLLDSAAEERFDRYTRLAKRLFGVPIALVSLVDAHRQWFKSKQGLAASETSRDVSFCGHAILGDEVLVVENTTEDDRFVNNPLVTEDPNIRFYAGCPISGPTGHHLGTICIIDRVPRTLTQEDVAALHDIGAMVSGELAALVMATMDELTGISNRRGFTMMGRQTLAACRRHQQPATLVLFDLDGFKEINDTLGHESGDAALVEFAGLLRACFRESDVIARLGGDEFCVLLSGTPESDAHMGVNRVIDAVRTANRAPGKRYALACSEGIVLYAPDRHDSIDALLGDADQQMYLRKQGKKPREPRS